MLAVAVSMLEVFGGSLGFAILFRVRSNMLLAVSVGGILTWGVYLLAEAFLERIVVITLVAAIAGACYAELMARICKTPSTVFFLPAVISLVPGRPLYYTVQSAAVGDWAAFRSFRSMTIEYACGIAAGLCLVWAVCDVSRRMRSVSR